jgi:hypothetical protein
VHLVQAKATCDKSCRLDFKWNCVVCGEALSRAFFGPYTGQKICSKQCFGYHSLKNTHLECAWCGKLFAGKLPVSDYHYGNCCSIVCQANHAVFRKSPTKSYLPQDI